MKENKKIDNKMKAKKLAAYTLATCMTVTVAPIGAVTPIMAEEVQSEMYGAKEVELPASLTVKYVCNIKPGMTFEEAQTAIQLVDTAETGNVGTIYSNKVVIENASGVELFDGSAYTNTATTKLTTGTKFEAGKKYVIKADFDVSGFVADSASLTVSDADGKITFTDSGKNDGSNATLALTAADYTVDLTTSSSSAHLEDYPTTAADGNCYYIDGKGNKLVNVNTVAQNSSGWWNVVNGVVTAGTTMASNAYGTWYIDSNGKVDFSKTDIVASTDDNGNSINIYVNKGKFDTSKTGVVKGSDGKEYNVVAGVAKAEEDIVQDKTTGQWVYFNASGVATPSFNGIAKNANGTWKVTGGIVTFTDNGLYTDAATSKTYFLTKSKVDTSKTGFVLDSGNLKYVKEGVVVSDAKLTKATVVHEPTSGDWYSVKKDGTVNNTDQFATNENGTWYIKSTNGTVDFDKTGLVKDTAGVIGDANEIYYVEKGKVRFDKSLIVNQATTVDNVTAGNYNVVNGVVKARDSKDAIAQAPDGKWYLFGDDGAVDTPTSPGLATNKYGVWYVKTDGTVDFNAKQFVSYLSGNDKTTLYYVEGGKVQTGKTGWVLDSGSARKYVVNGRVITPQNSIAKSTIEQCAADGKWYYVDKDVAGGAVSGSAGTDDFIASNQYGTWYVDGANGEVLFDKNGAFADPQDASKTYFFEKSKVVTNKSGFVLTGTKYTYFVDGKIAPQDVTGDCVIQNGADWLRVDDKGETETNSATAFDGIAKNKNGVWYIDDGKVDFDKNDLYSVTTTNDEKITGLAANKKIYINKGKFQNTKTGWVVANGTLTYVKNGVETAVNTTDVVHADDGNWYAVKAGVKDTSGIHLAENANGTWYIDGNGKVDFTKSGFVTLADGTICLVEKGKLVETKTDVVTVGGSSYYIEKGKVKGAESGETMLVTASNGKIYNIDEDGKVLKDVSFAKDKNGIWVTDANGVVDKTAKAAVVHYEGGVSPAASQVTISDLTDDTDYYVVGGKVQLDKSGLIFGGTTPKCVTKGVVTAYTTNDVVQGLDGAWYAVKNDGTLQTTAGVYTNDSGKWYVGSDGKVDFTKTGIVDGSDGKYYVVKGKVQADVTDVITVDGNMWNIKDGKVDATVDFATAKNGNIYYVKQTGIVQSAFTGAVETASSSGRFYWVEAGKVDKNASGEKVYGGNTYEFVDGIGTR